MFDFDELEEREGQPFERPPGLASPVRQPVADPEAPGRPPGLPSPPRAQGALLQLGLMHEVTLEELRALRGKWM